jgi:8-oxo-dGTP diphosphatase
MDAKQIFATYKPRAGAHSRLGRFCGDCGAEHSVEALSKPYRHCIACDSRDFANPTPAVSVLVTGGSRVLLCRRVSQSIGTGLWCLPAGYIEFDEDFLSAARREVHEETGLIVEVHSVISVVSNFFTPEIHSLVVVLHASQVGGRMAAGDDADQAEWFEPDCLPELAFEADAHIIQRFMDTPNLGVPVEQT